ncbi:MAG TPA: PQQ-binding-like beta-propeller repeat protein [Vicinamibacteria bacterium]|nr:PQQ-binding-like beta-propeller repeat protein [Vicinamibacteria bacterium]
MLCSPIRAAGLAVSLVPLLAAPVLAEDWSRFRGANGAGVSLSRGLPVEFGPGKNLDWAVDVPFGRSSPVFAGDRIFLTATEGGKLATLALDRASGKVLWRQALERSETAKLYHDNDSATPTPVTDGSNVYVLFHEAGVVSYDPAGRERWRHSLGPFRNFYGMSSSPVLAGDRLLVVCDQSIGSFVLALHKDTGQPLWRTDRPARRESYATPVLHPTASAPRELVVFGSRSVDAYDVATGKVAWTLDGVSSGPVASPLLAEGVLFVAGPDQEEEPLPPFAEVAAKHDTNRNSCLSGSEVEGTWMTEHFGYLDVDGSGCVSAEEWGVLGAEMGTDDWGVFAIQVERETGPPKVLWNYRKNVSYIPSPIVYENVFYMAKDGIVTSLDPRTGALHKRDRLGPEKMKVYASPVAGDGKVYFAGLEGQVAVVKAGPQWEVLGVNDLDEEIYATPAIVEGRLYVRTRGRLYSFSQGGKHPSPENAMLVR